MRHHPLTRRDFIRAGTIATLGAATGFAAQPATRPVVSIVRIPNDNTEYAVEKAIDLLGGIADVTAGKNSILLKPNLVSEDPRCTTKRPAVHALAKLMKGAGKEVMIGEGSAAAGNFNVKNGVIYRTRKEEILDPMQKYVFDQLGYSDLARSMHIPLINLHSGDLVDVPVPHGLAHEKLTLHKSLTDVDLLCSVPMMKTHVLATVTLGMKNLIGLYPGTVYYSVRSWLHDRAAEKGSAGVAFEILDMVRANKLGLVVVDASMAMEGNGPSAGKLVKMDLIIAGTNPLATDMVAARVMGFEAEEVPTFVLAQKLGMGPAAISDIEVRGERIESVQRKFARPNVIPWTSINKFWGVQEL
jgi:uncharacterized protein (DUF362 family)